ncbi:MAG: RNA polymerase sigma factor [Gammaproteobacteria bacterium]|nr:RNA polymerase sigma factor [Gammaproteobacteria bacterium]
MSPTDAELLQRMQRGDGEAFSALYQRHQQRVYRFASLYSGVDGVAADITQEVFMHLIDNHSFDPAQGELRAYLLGMARNLLRRHWRDAQRFEALPEEDEGPLRESLVEHLEPSMLVCRAQQHGGLRAAIFALPSYYREVMILCELEELDYLEAARILEVPIGTVRSRLNRARKALCVAMGAKATANAPVSDRGESYELRAV